MDARAALPARCTTARFATTLFSTTRPHRPWKIASAAATKANPSPNRKSPRRSSGAANKRRHAVASQIELIAVRHPAVAALPFLHIADAGKRHMKAGEKQPVGREHIQDPLTRRHGLVLVVIHLEMPFGTLHCHDVLRAGVGGDHETLAAALDMKREQPGRMTGGVDGGDARHDLVARFDER